MMKKVIEKIDASTTIMVLSLIALFIFAAASNASAAQGSDNRINRYVVAVSANYGGEGRPKLRYAESDAKAFANVLREMGGVQAQNVIVVKEPGVSALQKQLDGLDSRVSQNKNSGGRNEVLFYYSGHADEKGLRLGNEVYAWKELRKRIDALNADVKIAVIDACGSGAITRLKGGVAVPAFMVDQSSDMKGYAFITSSTQDESSQESDKLRGSFFTHSLVSGMRGGGDLSGDGKVTLSEAYQFAFNETLQKTETTIGGAQHPSRDMNLAGTGDVVMTDLRSTSAGLELDEDVDGRLFIRDEKGVLVAELYKKGGRSMSLGFPAGKYSVRLERPAEYKEATVTLQDNYRAHLTQKQFAAVSAEKTTLRGEIGDANRADSVKKSLDSLDHNGTYRMTFNLVDTDKEPRKGIQFGLFVTGAHDYMLGSQISLFANAAKKEIHGMQLTFGMNFARDRIEGAQVSSFVNIAGEFEGVQASFVNLTRRASHGMQLGYVNIGADTVSFMQAGFVNYMKYGRFGFGFANIAVASSTLQAGFLNVTKDSSDMQIGFTNVNGGDGGLQVGFFNYETLAKGHQIGFMNVCAKCEKTPIGFLSIVGNGVWSATTSLNEMGALDLALRFGTAYFFTSFEGGRLIEKGTGFKHFSDVYEFGVGLGTQFGKYGSHFDLEYMFLTAETPDVEFGEDCESMSVSFDDDYDGPNFHHRLRFGYTSQLVPFLGLSVGGTLNWAHVGYGDKLMVKPLAEYHDDFGSKNHQARWWPGFYAGVTVGRF
ncbi:MAG: caspase family protein [Fibrobacter sp.]|nr:caspase family protein [Fibrobacter sp.]